MIPRICHAIFNRLKSPRTWTFVAVALFSLTICLSLQGTLRAQEVTETVPYDSWPLVVLGIGIVTVLGLIIGLKINAFLALIVAALVVSLLASGDTSVSDRMERVVKAFGSSAGGIGIVIAMAAIIGKCMLDSGAADRIVRGCIKLFGPKQSSTALMGSGFILAVPVFFDTVFYLLVPLARSLHKRTGEQYLKYLMAIATGGAITHTLVPPTPGPLLMGANLNVDVGMMMLIGAAVAFPSAIVGLIFSGIVDKIMPIPMRPLSGKLEEPEPLPEDKLPPLWLSLMPVLLPVVMISAGTISMTLADREDKAQLTVADVTDVSSLIGQIRSDAAAEKENFAKRLQTSPRLSDQAKGLLFGAETVDTANSEALVAELNNLLLDRNLHTEEAFLGVKIPATAKNLLGANRVRMKNTDVRRMNRLLLETTYPDQVKPHEWNTTARSVANSLGLPGNANFALLVAAAVAIAMLWWVRRSSLKQLGDDVEEALLSGGMIILITAAGGAFGAMLGDADVGKAVEGLFASSGGVGGVKLLLLAATIAMVLKVAQGSSTVAMIVGSGIVGSIIAGQTLDYHAVYLGTAVGSGSLIGSWMNDSGFWVFTKMGGLTEAEGLKSWTLLLIVLGVTGLGVTILLSYLLPLV